MSAQTKPEIKTGKLLALTLAASSGGWAEWYDFLVAGIIAATVWPTVLFPSGNPTFATALSIATYGTIYAGRPVGSYIFGHLGDRWGRRNTLVISLLVMGVGTGIIAITPNYASIGLLAPIIIIICRLIQGTGIGGDFGNANAWVSEYVHSSKWRGFWTGFVQTGPPVGIAGSAFAIYALQLFYGKTGFIDFGWRVAFGIGFVVILIAALIRWAFLDSPLFRLLPEEKKERYPASRVFKEAWKPIVLLTLAINPLLTVYSGFINPYSVTYMTTLSKTITPTFASAAIGAAATLAVFTAVLGGVVSDKVGRKPVMIAFLVAYIIGNAVYIPIINTLNTTSIALILAFQIGMQYVGFGAFGAFASEQFPTRIRSSGLGFSLNLGAIVSAIVIIGIVPSLIGAYGGAVKAWPAMTAMAIVIDIIALICIMLMKERKIPDIATVEASRAQTPTHA